MHTSRAFRSDPNISIRIGSDRGFWSYRKRSDRIELFSGGPAIGSDRATFWVLRSDRIGSKHAFTHFGSDRIGSDRTLCFNGDSDREFLEFRPSK